MADRKSAAESDPVWADDKYLAKRYSVARSTIWRWKVDGKIPPPKRLTSGTSRWRLAEVIEALEGGL